MVAHHPGRPSAAGLATTGGCGKFDCDYYLAFRSSLAAGLPSLGSNPLYVDSLLSTPVVVHDIVKPLISHSQSEHCQSAGIQTIQGEHQACQIILIGIVAYKTVIHIHICPSECYELLRCSNPCLFKELRVSSCPFVKATSTT